MILYRSIGDSELTALLMDGHVHGRYNNATEAQNNSELNKVCCFFTDEIRWTDGCHSYFLKVDVPSEKILQTGVGVYYASKDFAKTKIWTGRRGSVEYKLGEVYVSEYSLADVKSIFGLHRFTNTHISHNIAPILEPFGIEIL